jgi:hypothetical protein
MSKYTKKDLNAAVDAQIRNFKKQAVADVVCYKCGAHGTVSTCGTLPLNDDGTTRALCHDCHSFWQQGKTRSGRDLPGQRFLCFNRVQKRA